MNLKKVKTNRSFVFDSKVIRKANRLSLFANYKKVEEHRHFAKHILVADEPFLCVVEGKEYYLSSSFIQSNVNHSIDYKGKSPIFMMLIDETSSLSDSIDSKYLKGGFIESLPESIYSKSLEYLYGNNLKEMDCFLIENLFDLESLSKKLDARISDVIDYIEKEETIESDLFKKMVEMTSLSESRFSHLFKSEVGIDFKNYLLNKKIEKTVKYTLAEKMSITEASIMAGFSSSAHFSNACKSHFGISLSDFISFQNYK